VEGVLDIASRMAQPRSFVFQCLGGSPESAYRALALMALMAVLSQ
jgi:hypothetical protein